MAKLISRLQRKELFLFSFYQVNRGKASCVDGYTGAAVCSRWMWSLFGWDPDALSCPLVVASLLCQQEGACEAGEAGRAEPKPDLH